jgi:hypothetical protein
MNRNTNNFVGRRTVTIAVGQTQSGALNVRGVAVIGVDIEAATEGATLALEYSLTGTSNWKPLKNSGGVAETITITAAAESFWLDPNKTLFCPFIRLVSSLAQAGADAVIGVHTRRFD